MGQYIINLFQDMTLLTIVLLSVGILLCIIEIFVPKVGLTGLFGIVLLGVGFSSYYIDGFKLNQMVSLLTIIAFVLAIFIMIEQILESKGIIHNPNRYKFRTYNDLNTYLNELVGKTAKAITNIDLGGTIEVDGQLYYAISSTKILAGSIVQVIGVKNNALVVKK